MANRLKTNLYGKGLTMRTKLIGVDIGSSTVKLAVWRGGAFRLASERLPDNLVKNGVIVSSELLARFLRDMRKKYGIPGRQCAVILPEYAVFFRRMSMPAISAEQLVLNLPYEFRDFTGMESAKYAYDYAVEHTLMDENGKPTSVEIVTAAAQKDVVRQYADLIRRSGMRLTVALPREMAIINLAKAASESHILKAAEFCIVDIGYEHTRMYIFRNTTLKAYKMIDIGCLNVDEMIAEHYATDKYLAASHRATNHEGILEKPVCTAVYERLSLEIHKALNFYRYGEGESAINTIYFAGEGSAIGALRETIAEDLGFSTHPIADILPEHTGDEHVAARCMAAVGVVL